MAEFKEVITRVLSQNLNGYFLMLFTGSSVCIKVINNEMFAVYFEKKVCFLSNNVVIMSYYYNGCQML